MDKQAIDYIVNLVKKEKDKHKIGEEDQDVLVNTIYNIRQSLESDSELLREEDRSVAEEVEANDVLKNEIVNKEEVVKIENSQEEGNQAALMEVLDKVEILSSDNMESDELKKELEE